MTQTFEEQFPELAKHIVDGDSKEMDNIDIFTEYVPTERVNEFCLDKQKVRDAIAKRINLSGTLEIDADDIEEFMKELGLDK